MALKTDAETLEALIFDHEPPCESGHRSVPCSGSVRWLAPVSPCGCLPRMLVCQNVRDHIFSPLALTITCRDCGTPFPGDTWRVGWRPV